MIYPRGFYEFVKPEIIQPQKEIVLMNKETGDLYEGNIARSMAGIGDARAVFMGSDALGCVFA